MFDDDSAAWFQRRFQGRKMRRGKGGGKRKGKGKGKGRGGRRFFKKKKGRSHLTEEQSDAWQAWIGKTKAGMKIGPGKRLKNPMPPEEKERKERKEKEKERGAKMGKVMARITFPMQLQKVQVLPLLIQNLLPHQLSSQCTSFPVSLRL